MVWNEGMRRVPERGTRVPTQYVWESRRIWGNCPIPRNIEVEILGVGYQPLVALRALVELVRRMARAVFQESLAQGIGLLRRLA